jgi:hypothetical protein
VLGYFPQVATILTRRSVALEAGELDPTLTGDTDWDWLLRIAKKHPIGRITKPVMLFRQRNNAPDEKLAWRRFPATIRIFRRHTRDLPIATRLRLEQVLWRHRGGFSWNFLQSANTLYAEGKVDRALRSLLYAFRASPPHAIVNCLRKWPLKR